MAINAVQICVFTALTLVPRNVFTWIMHTIGVLSSRHSGDAFLG
jgi:hypothetical protein